jgi:hypothetical protein
MNKTAASIVPASNRPDGARIGIRDRITLLRLSSSSLGEFISLWEKVIRGSRRRKSPQSLLAVADFGDEVGEALLDFGAG